MVDAWEGWVGGRELLKLDSGGSFHVAGIVDKSHLSKHYYIIPIRLHYNSSLIIQAKMFTEPK